MARHLSEVSATFSLLRQISSEFTGRSYRELLQRLQLSYFTDQREITAVKLAINDLAREVGDRPKIMLLFPAHAGFVARLRQNKNYSDQLNQFIGDFRSEGWTVIDMVDAFSEGDQSSDLTNLTLGCDFHWNAAANRKLAEFLLTNYRKDLTEVSTRSKVSARSK